MHSIKQAQQDLLGRLQQFANAADGTAVKQAAQPLTGAQQGSIASSFSSVLRAIDTDQHRASAATAAVSSGESDDLVGAMVESMRASVSFTALLQVRNKVATAFDDIMRMPL